MKMSTQKAIAVVAAGQPVQLIERPIPKVGAGEVLVKVAVAGRKCLKLLYSQARPVLISLEPVTPHDGLVRDIAYFVGKENLPGTIAVDVVGEIIRLGESVTSFKVGDTVMGQGDPAMSDTKGSQEYALLDADFIAKLPSSINPDQADTIILNALTSYVAVLTPIGLDVPSPLSDDRGFDYENTSILIMGGNSACGRFAIQLAKWAGVGTIITTAGKSGEAELKAMGATHVIDRSLSEEAIKKAVHDIVGDELLHVLDCVNRMDHTPGIAMLSNSKKGTFVPLAGSRPDTIDETRVGAKEQGYTIHKFVCRPVLFRDIAKQYYQALPKLIDEGVLKPTSFEVIKGLDVEAINAQLDKWTRREWPGRVNIHVR